MKIYYINLKKSNRRREKLLKTLIRTDIPYKRIEAVHGDSLSPEEIRGLCYKPSGLLCAKSMIGCYSSHLKAWKTFLKDKEQQYGIIMEDDCIINPEVFKKKAMELIDEINVKNPEWDFVYLGHYNLQLFDVFPVKYSHNIAKNAKTYDVPRKIPLGFHCYIINRKSAVKMLYKMKKMYYHVDLQFYFLSKYFSVYSSKERLAKQIITSKDSTQNSDFPKYTNKLVDKLFYTDEDSISPSYVLSSSIIKIPYLECSITSYFFILACALKVFNKKKHYIYYYMALEAITSKCPKERYNILCWCVMLYILT